MRQASWKPKPARGAAHGQGNKRRVRLPTNINRSGGAIKFPGPLTSLFWKLFSGKGAVHGLDHDRFNFDR
jgi:hypothetical protein